MAPALLVTPVNVNLVRLHQSTQMESACICYKAPQTCTLVVSSRRCGLSGFSPALQQGSSAARVPVLGVSWTGLAWMPVLAKYWSTR